jgi:hypothetical protein
MEGVLGSSERADWKSATRRAVASGNAEMASDQFGSGGGFSKQFDQARLDMGGAVI